MSTLLNKTRKLNKILQAGAEITGFGNICELLSEVMTCNVYLVNKKGKILYPNY